MWLISAVVSRTKQHLFSIFCAVKSFIYGAFKSTLLRAMQPLEIRGLGVFGESNEGWQLQCPDRNHYLVCPVKDRLVVCNYRAGLLVGAANLTGQLFV